MSYEHRLTPNEINSLFFR